jgi:hypothetical protein
MSGLHMILSNEINTPSNEINTQSLLQNDNGAATKQLLLEVMDKVMFFKGDGISITNQLICADIAKAFYALTEDEYYKSRDGKTYYKNYYKGKGYIPEFIATHKKDMQALTAQFFSKEEIGIYDMLNQLGKALYNSNWNVLGDALTAIDKIFALGSIEINNFQQARDILKQVSQVLSGPDLDEVPLSNKIVVAVYEKGKTAIDNVLQAYCPLLSDETLNAKAKQALEILHKAKECALKFSAVQEVLGEIRKIITLKQNLKAGIQTNDDFQKALNTLGIEVSTQESILEQEIGSSCNYIDSRIRGIADSLDKNSKDAANQAIIILDEVRNHALAFIKIPKILTKIKEIIRLGNNYFNEEVLECYHDSHLSELKIETAYTERKSEIDQVLLSTSLNNAWKNDANKALSILNEARECALNFVKVQGALAENEKIIKSSLVSSDDPFEVLLGPSHLQVIENPFDKKERIQKAYIEKAGKIGYVLSNEKLKQTLDEKSQQSLGKALEILDRAKANAEEMLDVVWRIRLSYTGLRTSPTYESFRAALGVLGIVNLPISKEDIESAYEKSISEIKSFPSSIQGLYDVIKAPSKLNEAKQYALKMLEACKGPIDGIIAAHRISALSSSIANIDHLSLQEALNILGIDNPTTSEKEITEAYDKIGDKLFKLNDTLLYDPDLYKCAVENTPKGKVYDEKEMKAYVHNAKKILLAAKLKAEKALKQKLNDKTKYSEAPQHDISSFHSDNSKDNESLYVKEGQVREIQNMMLKLAGYDPNSQIDPIKVQKIRGVFAKLNLGDSIAEKQHKMEVLGWYVAIFFPEKPVSYAQIAMQATSQWLKEVQLFLNSFIRDTAISNVNTIRKVSSVNPQTIDFQQALGILGISNPSPSENEIETAFLQRASKPIEVLKALSAFPKLFQDLNNNVQLNFEIINAGTKYHEVLENAKKCALYAPKATLSTSTMNLSTLNMTPVGKFRMRPEGTLEIGYISPAVAQSIYARVPSSYKDFIGYEGNSILIQKSPKVGNYGIYPIPGKNQYAVNFPSMEARNECFNICGFDPLVCKSWSDQPKVLYINGQHVVEKKVIETSQSLNNSNLTFWQGPIQQPTVKLPSESNTPKIIFCQSAEKLELRYSSPDSAQTVYARIPETFRGFIQLEGSKITIKKSPPPNGIGFYPVLGKNQYGVNFPNQDPLNLHNILGLTGDMCFIYKSKLFIKGGYVEVLETAQSINIQTFYNT